MCYQQAVSRCNDLGIATVLQLPMYWSLMHFVAVKQILRSMNDQGWRSIAPLGMWLGDFSDCRQRAGRLWAGGF